MDLKIKYKENYESLGSLRHFVESGIMLASVNFWRDSFQGYQEFEIIENREEFLSANEIFFITNSLNNFLLKTFLKQEKELK
jgi:hypothetical protein